MALRLPRERRSPGPSWVKHLMALPPRQQACYRPKLPADLVRPVRFGSGALWRRLRVAQYQPAALAELFRKSLQAAQTGQDVSDRTRSRHSS